MRNRIKSLFSTSVAEQNITAMKIAYELHDKEQRIYKQTRQFIKQNKSNVSLDYLFYDFQILCEFIERFYVDLGIQIKQEDLNLTSELLGLANRFLQIGHYDAAGGYLRKSFELWLNCFCQLETNNKKDKVKRLIKQRKYSSETISLDSDEVYKLYSYLSEMYAHETNLSSDILFDKNKYNQISGTMIVVIIVMSYLVIDMIEGDLLVKYRQKDILNPVDDYKFYAAYIGPLVGSGFVSSSKSWFLHGLEYSGIQSYKFRDKSIGLCLDKRIKDNDNEGEIY